MRRLIVPLLCAAVGLSSCTDTPLTGTSKSPRALNGPSFSITGFSANDPGAGPGDPRPNANTAAAAFDAAASALQPLKFETFEGAPNGNFSVLTLTGMTVALTGTAADVDAGITSVTGDAILGYNTTGNDGSHHLRIVPAGGPGVVTVTFTPTLKLQAWGAYFTGIGTVPNTSVELSFDDGSAQTFGIPGNESGGASFFGFTDPGKLISSVTVRETLTSSDLRDIFSIDDIRYASSSEEVQFVPAGQAATVTVRQDGKPVAGIDIPAGNTFLVAGNPVDVTVDVHVLQPGDPCHAFLLGQTGRCLEITARAVGGAVPTLGQALRVGVCIREDVPHGALDLFKFETATSQPLALKQVEVDKASDGTSTFIDCTGFVGSAPSNNRLDGFAVRLAKRIGDWLTPKPLYAAHLGFGGLIGSGGPCCSKFRWATPIQASNAVLGVNVLNSGKDAFALNGSFNLSAAALSNAAETGFVNARDAVTVGIGSRSYTISAGAFKYSPLLRKYLYASQTPIGVTAMSIDATTGMFGVAATVPTDPTASTTYRSFSLQIGNRAQGAGLVCAANHVCTSQEPPSP